MGKVKKVLLICVLAIISGGIIGTITGSNKKYIPDTYLKAEKIEDLNKISTQENLWLNRKCFNHYQSYVYGNKNEILDSNGMIYKDSDIIAYSDDKGLHVNDEIICGNSASYLNLYKNHIYYRNDMDRSIYCYDLKTKKIDSVLTGNYTQLKIVGNKMYYVDFKDDKLYSFSLNNKKCKKELDLKIKKYTVIGNKYIVLTKKRKLKFTDGEITDFSISGINDYFYNGNLTTLSDDGVYFWKSMGSPTKLELDKYNHILGINEDYLYLDNYDNASLKIFSINLKNNKVSSQGTFDKNVIINSYIKYNDIEYLQYSKIDDEQTKYYQINNFLK